MDLKSEADGEYLEIRVDPCPNPISYKGEYHHRSGSTKQVLRGAALNQFLLRKHRRNWDDAPMPGVGLADLDGRTLDEFRRRGVASGRLPADAVDGSDGDLMEMLHLREGHYLRRAAALLFHPDSARFFARAFVKIGYIALWNPGSLPLDWTVDKLMGTHASAPHTRPSPMPSSVRAWWRHGDGGSPTS